MPEDKPSRRKPKADTFEPFADDASVRTIGALSFENGTDRIALHGTLDLTGTRPAWRRRACSGPP